MSCHQNSGKNHNMLIANNILSVTFFLYGAYLHTK